MRAVGEEDTLHNEAIKIEDRQRSRRWQREIGNLMRGKRILRNPDFNNQVGILLELTVCRECQLFQADKKHSSQCSGGTGLT